MAVRPAAVLFDFDGVLVHSEPLHRRAFEEVALEQQIELSDNDYHETRTGYDDRAAFQALFAARNRDLPPALLLKMMARKRECAGRLVAQGHYEALPGVEALVRGLWRVYPLAICSGALREEIELMLEGIRLRDCFRVIIAAEDVAVGKPDPSGYLKAAAALSVLHHRSFAPADCVIFEDAPWVIDRVKPLGFQTVGVAGTVPAARLANADFIVHSLEPAEVLRAVPGLTIYE